MIKIDLDTLRVFNSIYKLKIEEEEFKEVEEEQSHTERTGLAIVCVKKGRTVIGISHDQKHKIIIRKIKGEIKVLPKSRVLFKTLVTIFDLPEEIYTLHAIAQYRALDTEIKYVARNLEELKDRVCDRYIDSYPKTLGEQYQDVYCETNEREKNKLLRKEAVMKQLKALFWLFDEDFSKFEPIVARPNLAKIIKVFTRNNRRIAIIQLNERFLKGRGGMFQNQWKELIERTLFKIETFTPRDERYKWVCPNRELYLKDHYNEKITIWLDDKLTDNVTAEELKVLSERYEDSDEDDDGRFIFLTADEFNNQKSEIRIEMMNAKRKEEEEETGNKLMKKIEQQFKKGKVIRQGIVFTKNSVSYEGIDLKGKRLGEYLVHSNIILQDQPNFNDIFGGYVDYLLDMEVVRNRYDFNKSRMECRFRGKDTITLGKIKILIEQINNNIFIDNKRICKDDLHKIIKSAINFNNNQKKFDEWVAYTSKINLKLQKALQDKGMKFELKIDTTDDNALLEDRDTGTMLLSIPLIRKKNKNYVKIDDKKYKIKDINSFFDLSKDINSCKLGHSGGGYLQRTIKLLYRAIEGITPKEIGDLIQNGKKEFRKMQERIRKENEARLKKSKEFIENAIRLSNAKKTKDGYLVKGISKITYFVDEDSLEVWTIEKGKQKEHLCIVDTDYSWESREDEALTNDRVAKRLLMLSQDKKVAKELYENGDKLDKHWQDISNKQEEKIDGSVMI